jgi:hypothetical protein
MFKHPYENGQLRNYQIIYALLVVLEGSSCNDGPGFDFHFDRHTWVFKAAQNMDTDCGIMKPHLSTSFS